MGVILEEGFRPSASTSTSGATSPSSRSRSPLEQRDRTTSQEGTQYTNYGTPDYNTKTPDFQLFQTRQLTYRDEPFNPTSFPSTSPSALGPSSYSSSERKEKYLKDLETEVSELTKAQEFGKHENGVLKAQVERLHVELKECRKRLSLNGSSGHDNLVAERLRTANLARSTPHASTMSQEKSPFRDAHRLLLWNRSRE